MIDFVKCGSNKYIYLTIYSAFSIYNTSVVWMCEKKKTINTTIANNTTDKKRWHFLSLFLESVA